MKQDDKLYNELSSDHMEIYREKAAKQAKTEKTTAKRRQQGRFHLKHK